MKIIDQEEKKIYIQSITADDVNDTYVEWLNDPQVNQYLETRLKPQNLVSITSFVKSSINNPKEHLFTINTSSDRHIGNIKVGAIDQYHGTGEVSLFIGDKNCWGKGYATLAITLISYFAFSILKLRKLSAGAYLSNKASTKAFIKTGYQIEGIKKAQFKFNNKFTDAIYVCLFSHQSQFPNSLKVEKLDLPDNK